MTIQFVIGTSGLNTSIDKVYSLEKWEDDDNLPANMHWEHVEVATKEDKEAYIAAKNRYLRAAWTPNQSSEDRAENAKIEKEAQAEMDRLCIQ